MKPADLLTSARLLLVPLFVVAEVSGFFHTALATAVAAVVSDVADGRAARRRGSSAAGPVLDIAADFAFVIAAFAVLVRGGFLPAFLPPVATAAFALYCTCCICRRTCVRLPLGRYAGAACMTLIVGVLVTRLGMPFLYLFFARWGALLLAGYLGLAALESAAGCLRGAGRSSGVE